MPSTILSSRAVAFATDMLTTVFRHGASEPASRRPVTWCVIFIIGQSLQVRRSPLVLCRQRLCCENSARCCVKPRPCRWHHFVSAFICLMWWDEEERFGGFVPTTPSLLSCALVCAAESEGCSEDWILGRSFTYHYRDLRLWKTFIKVFGLML